MIDINVEYRKCVRGEVFKKLFEDKDIKNCEPCPGGKYSLETPVNDINAA